MLFHKSTHSALALFALLAAFALTTTTVVAGAIYKSVDQDGNVIFTDRPLEGAENLNGETPAANSPNTDKSAPTEVENDDDHEIGGDVALAPEPKNPPKSSYKEPAAEKKFLPVTVVEILSPIHNTTLNDPIGKIWVELQSYPTPLKKSGLTAELWMNDILIISGKRPMLSLPIPERGTHVLQVKLVDSKGRLVLESATTHLHVKHRVSSN